MEPPLRWLGRARLAGWPVLELLVSVGVQVLLTPVLLHRLGSQQFGVWIIVQSTLLASTALSLGASAGFLPVLSATLHRGDVAGAGAAMRWFFRRVAAVSLSALICIAIAISTGFVPRVVPPWAEASVWPLAMAALAWMTSTELDNAISSALKAQGRFGLAARTESAARIAQLALIAVLVDAGSSALAPILVSLCVTVVKLIVRLAALRQHLLIRSAAGGAADSAGTVPRELVMTGIWVWIGMLGSLAFNTFDRWFVGAWFGASTLASYAICTQLAQLPHAVVSAAGQVLVLWAARNVPGNSRTSTDRAALKLLAQATALAALPSLLLLPLLEPVLGLWISKDFAHEHLSLGRGLTTAFLLLCLNVPAYFLLLGMGQARFTTIVISSCGALFVLGALSLPRDLSTFVVLKGLFAALSLSLPVGCALRLRARTSPSP
jgi:O-antigen/teichoic acid export membrane protein